MSELKPFDEFMDALVHCDIVKVILTGCGESTFETKPIHEGICALANRRAERTGRWEGYVCSECGVSSDYGSEPYCPNCGAKMDAPEKEDNDD